MKDLMVHVERIVRPIRANQSRKLRMRRELLAHLQAALEEERSSTTDEASALKKATQRLGNPSDLTRQLQETVPILERLLHASTPEKWNRWENRLGRHFVGAPIMLTHWLILVGSGALAVLIIWVFSPHISPKSRTDFFVSELDHPGRTKTLIMVIWSVQMFWLFIGWRFMLTAAAPGQKFRLLRIGLLGSIVLGTQATLMWLIITQIVQRPPTIADMAPSLGAGFLLLAAGILVGRGVAALRRPFDEWLMLDLT